MEYLQSSSTVIRPSARLRQRQRSQSRSSASGSDTCQYHCLSGWTRSLHTAAGHGFHGISFGVVFSMGFGDCQTGSLLFFEHAASPQRQLGPHMFPKWQERPHLQLRCSGATDPCATSLKDPNSPQYSHNPALMQSSMCTNTQARKQVCKASLVQFPEPNPLMKLQTLGLMKLSSGGQAAPRPSATSSS